MPTPNLPPIPAPIRKPAILKPAASGETVLNLNKSTAGYEIRRRIPWMFVGLLAGVVMILVGQNFEQALARRLELAFFIPMIVYMSDSIGTETMALFIRELALRRVSLRKLFWREVFVGLSLGFITGVPMGLFSYFWFKDFNLASTVTIAMTVNGVVAVLTGAIAPVIFTKFKKDPALGTDEITTAFSDIISIVIYLAVATAILF